MKYIIRMKPDMTDEQIAVFEEMLNECEFVMEFKTSVAKWQESL